MDRVRQDCVFAAERERAAHSDAHAVAVAVREHQIATFTRLSDGCAPQRRLPDAGLSFEPERRRRGPHPIEKFRERRELALPADDAAHLGLPLH
jgi:hypothetical protein